MSFSKQRNEIYLLVSSFEFQSEWKKNDARKRIWKLLIKACSKETIACKLNFILSAWSAESFSAWMYATALSKVRVLVSIVMRNDSQLSFSLEDVAECGFFFFLLRDWCEWVEWMHSWVCANVCSRFAGWNLISGEFSKNRSVADGHKFHCKMSRDVTHTTAVDNEISH